MPEIRDVDPRELRVPLSRRHGADPAKLAPQISLFGRSGVEIPPPWAYEGMDGVLEERVPMGQLFDTIRQLVAEDK